MYKDEITTITIIIIIIIVNPNDKRVHKVDERYELIIYDWKEIFQLMFGFINTLSILAWLIFKYFMWKSYFNFVPKVFFAIIVTWPIYMDNL